MAKVGALPSQNIIKGYKGKLDYFVQHGQVYVRSWPRKPRQPRSAPVQAQWAAWTYASRLFHIIDGTVYPAYQAMADGSPRTARDVATSLYYGKDMAID